jgi:hypothetical protein
MTFIEDVSNKLNVFGVAQQCIELDTENTCLSLSGVKRVKTEVMLKYGWGYLKLTTEKKEKKIKKLCKDRYRSVLKE